MSSDIHQQMTVTDIVMLIVLSVLWGGSFFFIEVLVGYWPPLTIVVARVALAALFLWAIIFIARTRIPKTWSVWGTLAFLAFLNNVLPFTLIVWGQTHIDSGLASILNATTPFFTVIVAAVFLTDERLSGLKLGGVIIGLVGTVVLIGPKALQGANGALLGQIAVIGAALSYAFAAAFSRRFKGLGLSPIIVAAGQVTMASIMLLPLALIVDQPWTLTQPPLSGVLSLIGLALFSTGFAYILYFRLIASAGATNAALVTFLVPISAVLLGVIFLEEVFNSQRAMGMGLIALGLMVMDGRIFRRNIS